MRPEPQSIPMTSFNKNYSGFLMHEPKLFIFELGVMLPTAPHGFSTHVMMNSNFSYEHALAAAPTIFNLIYCT